MRWLWRMFRWWLAVMFFLACFGSLSSHQWGAAVIALVLGAVAMPRRR